MKYFGWAALGLLIFCLSGRSPAEAVATGRELAAACADGPSTEQIFLSTHCMAYLSGFVDAYQLSMAVMERQVPKAKKPICLPPRGVDHGQMKALVNDWLKRNPSEHDETARTVVYLVLATAYPCGQAPVKWK
jgi:Rap1a immunity proteins